MKHLQKDVNSKTREIGDLQEKVKVLKKYADRQRGKEPLKEKTQRFRGKKRGVKPTNKKFQAFVRNFRN